MQFIWFLLVLSWKRIVNSKFKALSEIMFIGLLFIYESLASQCCAVYESVCVCMQECQNLNNGVKIQKIVKFVKIILANISICRV